MNKAHTALSHAGVNHALIGDVLPSGEIMSFDEYLDFLDEYWEIFGPIPPAAEKPPYENVKL